MKTPKLVSQYRHGDGENNMYQSWKWPKLSISCLFSIYYTQIIPLFKEQINKNNKYSLIWLSQGVFNEVLALGTIWRFKIYNIYIHLKRSTLVFHFHETFYDIQTASFKKYNKRTKPQIRVRVLFDPKSLINFIWITVTKPKQAAVLLYYMYFDILKTFPVKIPIRDNLNW